MRVVGTDDIGCLDPEQYVHTKTKMYQFGDDSILEVPWYLYPETVL